MKKTSFLWTLTFLLLFNVTGLVSAEEKENPLKMEELTVQVLPEYSFHPKAKDSNHPPLLVGYHGSLINNTEKPLKGQIEIPLPTKDKNFKLGFVADYSTDLREMYEIEYKLDEELGIISWETSEEIQPQEIYKFVIEYYTDSIIVSNDKKSLEYTFTSFVDIGMMNLIFVEPLKTESFALEPAAETHQKNGYNLNMYLYQSNGMKIGDEKTIKLEYERVDDRTTAEIMEEMAGSENKQVAATKKNEEKVSPWLIISVVGGISVIASIILILVLKNRGRKMTKQEKSVAKDSFEIKKAKIRQMVIDGKITEEEYKELSKRLGGKNDEQK